VKIILGGVAAYPYRCQRCGDRFVHRARGQKPKRCPECRPKFETERLKARRDQARA
jgi:DNA-directed RNA polymerase subunit RPC12/RpoP